MAISGHRRIAILLKRACRIDIDISDGLRKLKYITHCFGRDVSSSNLVIIVCPFLSVLSFVNFTSIFLIAHISATTYQIYFIIGS